MEAKETKYVSELEEREYLMLVTESNAVDVLEHIGAADDWPKHQVAFVDTDNAEYSEVWVCWGIVANTWKKAYRLI